MSTDYEVQTYIQTVGQLRKKRIVVQLFEVSKKLVKQYFIDINPEEFTK